MKGVNEAMMNLLIAIVLGGLAFIFLMFILNYFGVNLVTPLCRTFCFPVMNVVVNLLKAILIGYVTSPSSMCGFCG
ncbi:MAG: hypothetical protein KKB25_01650 [Nanoarchaeota archaeon]|nr:hypothetical protein [Nanoarchaeota archaeon]